MYNVTYISDEDLYLVVPPQAYYRNNHTINGKSIPDTQFTCKEKPVIKVKKTVASITNYKHKQNETIVFPNEYTKMYNDLTSKGSYDDDDCSWSFDTIEDEVAYKYFVRDWQAVYEIKEWEEEVQYEVKRGMLSSGEDFIDSMISIDSNQASLFVYRRTQHLLTLFNTFKAKYTDAKWDLPTHSGLYYVKMNGEYLFSNNDLFKLEGKNYTNNLSACKVEKEQTEKVFKTTINSKMTYINGNVSQVTIADFKLKLTNINNDISTLLNSTKRDIKSSTASNSRNKINQMISTLNEIALNGN